MTPVNKRIFISPLDWGLGHASRCVSIIQDLKKNNTIVIGTTDLNAFLFKYYFPELEQLTVPSYEIHYSKFIPLWLKLMFQSFRIRKVIKLESKFLKDIIEKHNIDLVISDNRFGMYSEKTHCVFITHQLNIKSPLFTSFINKLNRKFIHHFSEVWVPDTIDLGLSGSLSDASQIKIPVKYIGPISALMHLPESHNKSKIDILILLSGIEPLRTELETVLLKKYEGLNKKIVIVRGTNRGKEIRRTNIQVIDFAYGEELRNLIVNAETVICRSGYSSLMDLYLLNKKKLILIPTPGQSEQIYLAKLWKAKFGAEVYETKDLNKLFKIR